MRLLSNIYNNFLTNQNKSRTFFFAFFKVELLDELVCSLWLCYSPPCSVTADTITTLFTPDHYSCLCQIAFIIINNSWLFSCRRGPLFVMKVYSGKYRMRLWNWNHDCKIWAFFSFFLGGGFPNPYSYSYSYSLCAQAPEVMSCRT